MSASLADLARKRDCFPVSTETGRSPLWSGGTLRCRLPVLLAPNPGKTRNTASLNASLAALMARREPKLVSLDRRDLAHDLAVPVVVPPEKKELLAAQRKRHHISRLASPWFDLDGLDPVELAVAGEQSNERVLFAARSGHDDRAVILVRVRSKRIPGQRFRFLGGPSIHLHRSGDEHLVQALGEVGPLVVRLCVPPTETPCPRSV